MLQCVCAVTVWFGFLTELCFDLQSLTLTMMNSHTQFGVMCLPLKEGAHWTFSLNKERERSRNVWRQLWNSGVHCECIYMPLCMLTAHVVCFV